MSSINDMIGFQTPDGTLWGVEVSKMSGPSNALIIFHHPDGRTSRKDRYAWLNWHGPQASDVTVSLTPAIVKPTLTQAVLRGLFTRSMLIGPGRVPAPTMG
jgi:hypothetical protein